MADMWSRRVFVALLRRYEITPYRFHGQRRTTVMAKVSKRFVDETLWPEFQALSASLRTYLDDVTNRVVSEVIHADVSEAAVMDEPKQLPLDVEPEPATTTAASTTPSGTSPKADSLRKRKRSKKKQGKKGRRR